jgi:hypothetical protein
MKAVISGIAGRARRNPDKAQTAKIKLIHEYIDRPHWVVVENPVVQPFGKHRALAAVDPLNETLHLTLQPKIGGIITRDAFSHSLGHSLPNCRPAGTTVAGSKAEEHQTGLYGKNRHNQGSLPRAKNEFPKRRETL